LKSAKERNAEKLKSEILSRRSALRKEKRLTFLRAVLYFGRVCGDRTDDKRIESRHWL